MINRVPPTRRLSIGSSLYKVVLPAVLVLAAPVVAGVSWFSRGVEGLGEATPIVLVLAVMGMFSRLFNGHLADEVFDGGDYVRVRIGREAEDVLLRDVERVEESIWRRQPPQLELVLKRPGPFGRVIAFIPKGYSLMPFGRSPVFHELSARLTLLGRQ